MVDRQTTSDEDLMHLAKAGNRQCLSTLMRRYANSLLTWLRRMTGDHHRSEELFQDVFLTVWIQRNEYEYPRPFRAWLFGIAVNKCRTDVRSRNRKSLFVDGELAQNAPAGRESPQEAAVATETATIVEQAVLQLPDQQRQVVVLRVWHGLSYQAIGEILGRTEGTARSHMCHALDAMRQFLEPRLRTPES